MEEGGSKGGQTDVSRILLGAADFEVGKRDHDDTGGLYKLEKAGNRFSPRASRRNTALHSLILALEDPC